MHSPVRSQPPDPGGRATMDVGGQPWTIRARDSRAARLRGCIWTVIVLLRIRSRHAGNEVKAGERAGLTNPRNSVKECKTTQGFLTLQERQSWACTLDLNKTETL
jgi:hypothetical protein